MTYSVKINSFLKEKIFINTLSSGAKCYIIPKKRFSQAMAAAVFNFGSENIMFSADEEEKVLPAGTAHFLEHKMFESAFGDAMELFAKNGADSNAFTDFKKTAYVFTCGKRNFYSNLETLLKFCLRPGFTPESVESEKSIIKSEISMYDDSPERRVFINLMNCLYKEYPLKYDVAGSAESVESITINDLLAAFGGFYKPSNMSIVCVGDIDPEETFKIAEKLLKKNNDPSAEKLFPQEVEEIAKDYHEEITGISKPVFNLGFKEKNPSRGIDVKRFCGVKILLEILFGKGSLFFERLYQRGILTEPLDFQYLTGHDFSSAIIGGRSEDPLLVRDEIFKELETRLQVGIDRDSFVRVMKMESGRFIRGLDYPDSVFMSQIELSVSGADIADAFDAAVSIDREYVENLMKEILKEEKSALSVVK